MLSKSKNVCHHNLISVVVLLFFLISPLVIGKILCVSLKFFQKWCVLGKIKHRVRLLKAEEALSEGEGDNSFTTSC